MLWLLLGDYGGGKTLRLVLEAYSEPRDCYGNFTISGLDNYTKIVPADLKDIKENALVVLDEMQTWLESRVSMSFLNRFVTNIINQADKKDIDYFGSAHLFNSLDIRFRSNVHRIITCERIGREAPNRTRTNDKRDFRFKIMNTYSGKIKKKRLRYRNAIKYFDVYDTREVIDYPDEKDLFLDLMMKQDQHKAYLILKELAQRIKESDGKVKTHSDVEVRLLDMGYSAKHGRLIYSLIREMERE